MGKSSSSTSLASHSSECSLLTPKALPATSEPAHGDPPLLALPAPPAHETNHEKGDAEKASHDNDQSPGKSLEEYAKEAMQRVSQKKAKELDAVVKRPASKKAFAKVKASPKSKVQKQEKMKHTTPAFDKGIFGCVRCRGNTKGCSVCWSPFFGGKRFSSRQGYNKWYQKKQQGQKRK